MSTILTLRQNPEEWADADFEIPDDHPIAGNNVDWETPAIIRPPLKLAEDCDDDDDEEGVSTIKVNVDTIKPLPKSPDSEDFEDGFALPDDLTQLSLAPLSLSHRSSKNSLEAWGEKDQTSSSQSSDAYSTLGLVNASPSSNSNTSASLPESETDDEEDDIEGLVIPSGLFDKGSSASHIKKVLEIRQKLAVPPEKMNVSSPDQEDDFEKDLVIDESADLSPSRLLHTAQREQNKRAHFARSNSMPVQKVAAPRPPSRLLKSERVKSPTSPSPSRALQKLRLSPSPPLNPPSAFPSSFQALSPGPSPPNFPPKSSSLRGQKSHTGLKPPISPSSTRPLRRKASLSSLLESSSPSSASSNMQNRNVAPYAEPTAASRARHKQSSSRLSSQEYKVPPARPSTPSNNTAALRLTLPSQGRLSKARPALASIFGASSGSVPSRTHSPAPRPPSSASQSRPHAPHPSQPMPVSKVLRRPKRPRTYGDGTELDAFDDLPTDRDKEMRYRVQPKQFGNRVPGGTYSSNKPPSNATLRRVTRQGSSSFTNNAKPPPPEPPVSRFSPSKKKKKAASNHTKRKPTLIRNLGGSSVEKVVGNMKWNPHSLRWEGNEQALREFDAAAGTSTRPALITHLTGSSIGSPASTFAAGTRVVGNMIFDPSRMCWISTLPPDEEEPDVFANLADDEDDDDWDRKGATIRANVPSDGTRSPNSSTSSSSYLQSSRSRAVSTTGSDRGSRASLAFDIDESFVAACRQAASRHRQEMKGWRDTFSKPLPLPDRDRASLYEIRAIARRNYES